MSPESPQLPPALNARIDRIGAGLRRLARYEKAAARRFWREAVPLELKTDGAALERVLAKAPVRIVRTDLASPGPDSSPLGGDDDIYEKMP